MRSRPIFLALLLALVSSLTAMLGSSANAIGYAQPVGLVREKYENFGSSTNTGINGMGWTFAKSDHVKEMRVFRVKGDELPRFNIYIAEVTLDRRYVQEAQTSYAWKEISIATPKRFDRKVKRTGYSETLRPGTRHSRTCWNASASLSVGVGPVSAGVSVSKAILCDSDRETRVAFREVDYRTGKWRLERSGAVKSAKIQKVIKIPANSSVPFVVRTKAPCDYQDQFGELQYKQCTSKTMLRYPAHK